MPASNVTVSVTFSSQSYNLTNNIANTSVYHWAGTYTLSVEAEEGGSIDCDVDGIYEATDVIEIAVVENEGYEFMGWTSSAGGIFESAASPATKFSMPATDVVLTAHFRAIEVPVPIITIITQPQAVTNVTEGLINAGLTVSASVTLGAELSYQWYSNTTDSTSGGVPINGATSAGYTIPTDLTADGSPYYYYCIVSATGGAEAVVSALAAVTVDLPAPPDIPVQSVGHVLQP